jgi:hypothetical protein
VSRSSLDGDGEADSKSSVVQTLKFDYEEKNSCNFTFFDKSEDISMRVVLMRHNFAHDSAMEIINTGIGRVANREISCKKKLYHNNSQVVYFCGKQHSVI